MPLPAPNPNSPHQNVTSAFQHALHCAKTNAAYFKRNYAVILTSTMRWEAQSVVRDTQMAFAVVWPDGAVQRSTTETTVGELLDARRDW